MLRQCMIAFVAVGLWTTSYAQQPPTSLPESWSPDAVGGPFTTPPVPDAPFSADATTTVEKTLENGRRIDISNTARHYRDREGRVRVEQAIIAAGQSGSGAPATIVTLLPDPQERRAYRLDPATRVARYGPPGLLDLAVSGGSAFVLPIGGARVLTFLPRVGLTMAELRVLAGTRVESLGGRRIAGLQTVGHRLTLFIPIGLTGNSEPLEIIDERWESPELQLLVYGRNSDHRGHVEYWLSDISRVEPPLDLFVVPPDYTIRNADRDEPWIAADWGRTPEGTGTPRR